MEGEKPVGNFVDDILDQLPSTQVTTIDPEQLSKHQMTMMEQAKTFAQTVDVSIIEQQIRESLMHPEGLQVMKREVGLMHPHLSQEQIEAIFVPENFEQLVRMGVMAATHMKQL